MFSLDAWGTRIIDGREMHYHNMVSRQETAPRGVLLLAKIAVLAIVLVLAGCVGPPALQRAVIGYDETTAKLDQQLLLLNIARLSSGLPIHFTTTSSIAASFDWSTTFGAAGRLEEQRGTDSLTLNLGATARERPTFSIIPLSGEQFTRRILTPFEETVFNFFIFQGGRIDQALRLMSEGFEYQKSRGAFVRSVDNNPSKPRQFEEFRRIVTHLQWLHENQQLYVRTLVFEEMLIKDFKGVPKSQDITKGFEGGSKWRQKKGGHYTFSRLVSGRKAVTNYDTRALKDHEMARLNEKIKRNPSSFVYVHISPDHPGGEFPIRGVIRLRSLLQMLQATAYNISRIPEFEVAKDSRTGPVQTGPPMTLKINVTDTAPPGNVPQAEYGGQYYSIADTPWDRKSFTILSYLFQTAVGEVKDVGIPITISK